MGNWEKDLLEMALLPIVVGFAWVRGPGGGLLPTGLPRLVPRYGYQYAGVGQFDSLMVLPMDIWTIVETVGTIVGQI